MNPKRRLTCESLEKRRLLAANCEPFPSDSAPAVLAAEGEQASRLGIPTDDFAEQSLSVGDVVRPEIYYGAPDLVQEVGNRLFVVDQEPFSDAGSKLFVFDRLDDGSLETAFTYSPDFAVNRMMVVGEQVLLFGTDHEWFPLPLPVPVSDAADDGRAFEVDTIFPPGPRTIVATVNLASDAVDPNADGTQDADVTRQAFDGVLKDLHQDGDRLVMILSANDYVIAIFPPPTIRDHVVLTRITADGLQEVASIEIESGQTAVQGDSLLTAVTRHSDIHFFPPPGDASSEEAGIWAPDGDAPFPHVDPMAVVMQYRIGAESIDLVDELELGSGFVHDLNLAEDGLSAYVIRSHVDATGTGHTAIDLLEIVNDDDPDTNALQLFDTVLISEFNGYPLVSGPDFVLLRDYAHADSVLLVNTDTSIDLAVENRLTRVEIPESLNLLHTHVMLSEGQLVLLANRYINTPFLHPATDALIAPQSPETLLVNISVTAGVVNGITELEDRQALPPYELYLIDAAADRFGFLTMDTSAAGRLDAQFHFGHLDDEGLYVSDGSIDEIGFWREIDTNPDRLIVRAANRIVEYDWDNPGEPVAVIPLIDPNVPPIEAVNDVYTFVTQEDQLLEVLANDQIPETHPPLVEIVELIGAPEGVEIVGHAILVPAEAFDDVDALRFEYVISDGLNTSSAVVEIDVDVVTDEQVNELVEAVRRQAADDFGVTVEEVEIVVVERIFDQPLPVVLPDGGRELDLSPGILVTLNVPETTAFYAASLEGEIYRLFSSQREILAELSLRAVDQNGVHVDTLAVGQEFWLEFIADDQRDFGEGVYAAFFDLHVPVEQIRLADVGIPEIELVEYGPGFGPVAGGELREDGLTDFGAVSVDVEAPGNAPQQVFRVRAIAVAAGDVTLRPEASDGVGTATLLHGVNAELQPSQVRYRPLELRVSDEPVGDHMDVDGNGEVTAGDALRVINFLATYGSTALDELDDRVAEVRGEGETDSATSVDAMRRYDANRDGQITALDALVIVNRLGEDTLAAETPPTDTAEAERIVAAIPQNAADTLSGDDDEDQARGLIF